MNTTSIGASRSVIEHEITTDFLKVIFDEGKPLLIPLDDFREWVEDEGFLSGNDDTHTIEEGVYVNRTHDYEIGFVDWVQTVLPDKTWAITDYLKAQNLI